MRGAAAANGSAFDGLRVGVVGGGVSGVAATHYLQRAGITVELIERESWLGGRCETSPLGSDREVTFGGKNIGRRYTEFRSFVASLGPYEYESFGINSSRVENGEVRTLDTNRRRRSLSAVTRGLPRRDLVRFGSLCARVLAQPANRYLGSPYFARLGDRHDHRPLADHFGPAFQRAAIRPMTVRMNGAEPDEAYLGNFGSNLGMLLDTYDQVRQGLGEVLRDFAARTNALLGSTAEGLVVRDGGVAGVRIRQADGAEEERLYDAVVIATPAPVAAELVRPLDEELADGLAGVSYFPAAVVLARYDRDVFPEETRAFVFDGDAPLSNAGAYGIEDRHIVRYTFSGRAGREKLGGSFAPEDLLEAGEDLLSAHTSVGQAERGEFVGRQWERAYCAYSPYHSRLRAQVASSLASRPGLALAGDYLRGASIEACFRAARESVDALLAAPEWSR